MAADLGSQLARAHTSPADEQELASMAERAGLGRGTIPPRLMADLTESLGTAGTVMAQALACEGDTVPVARIFPGTA